MTAAKDLFIRKALQEYMTDVIAAMRREIQRRGLKDTGDLLESLSYNVYQRDAQGNGTLSFAEWGRMLDMGVGRGHPLGGLKNLEDALSQKRGKDRVRKPQQIYSPIAYGKLNGLIGELSYGFTEETKQAIIAELDASQHHS